MSKTGKRLYYNDSYLFEFESVVETVLKREYYEIILRESAFYPESGGQLFDTGSLNDFKVTSVYVNENDEVVHCCEKWSGVSGQKVFGRINRERRLDNMRKHTGQHILSQAFLRIASAETVGAHLGEIESTIELDSPELAESNLKAIEFLANDIIMRNLPVVISYHDFNELGELGVRRIPERQGEYRLVGISDFELTACGGTHCAFTGEIGLLKIVAQEKIRSHSRITFLCGHHSVNDSYLKNKVINKLTTTRFIKSFRKMKT
jgi:alanyl-tRNA synthetase